VSVCECECECVSVSVSVSVCVCECEKEREGAFEGGWRGFYVPRSRRLTNSTSDH